MRKFLSALMLCAALSLFALAACNKDGSGVAELMETDGNTVVIKAIKTDASVSLADVLSSLKEQGKLDYEGRQGDYGLEILSINGYTPDSDKKEFWAIYTTLGEYEGVSYSDGTWGTFVYKDETLNSAAFGVSQMPIIAGELYILTISTY